MDRFKKRTCWTTNRSETICRFCEACVSVVFSGGEALKTSRYSSTGFRAEGRAIRLLVEGWVWAHYLLATSSMPLQQILTRLHPKGIFVHILRLVPPLQMWRTLPKVKARYIWRVSQTGLLAVLGPLKQQQQQSNSEFKTLLMKSKSSYQ